MGSYDLSLDPDLGRKAEALRRQLGLTIQEVARRAGVSETDVTDFERSGDARVSVMLAIHRAIASGFDLSQLFAVPRFETLDDVVDFEKRRLANR